MISSALDVPWGLTSAAAKDERSQPGGHLLLHAFAVARERALTSCVDRGTSSLEAVAMSGLRGVVPKRAS